MTPDAGESARFIPNRVLTANEVMRIGVALHVYGGQRRGRSYVVMTKERPHEVLGVVGDLRAAEALLRSAARPDAHDIYGPFDPPHYPYANKIWPSEHDEWTHCSECNIKGRRGDSGDPEPGDIVKMTLTVDWKRGGPRNAEDTEAPNSITYEIQRDTDAVFVTRFGREGFVYPRYHTLFGADYVRTLRERLRDPA